MSAADTFPLADIPRRLDELLVHYLRDNKPWKHAAVDVTLHAPSVPFPRAARTRANARPLLAGTVVWRRTLLCPGTHGCTPRNAARAAKSKSARCNNRLRVEVVVAGEAGAFAARLVEHGAHGAHFAAPAASERKWLWQRKLLKARPLADAVRELEEAGVASVRRARVLLQQQQAHERRKRARLAGDNAEDVAEDAPALAFDWAAFDAETRAELDALEARAASQRVADGPSLVAGVCSSTSSDSEDDGDAPTRAGGTLRQATSGAIAPAQADGAVSADAHSLGGTRSSDDGAAEFAFDHPAVLALLDVLRKSARELAGFGDEMLLAMIEEALVPFLGAERDEPPEPVAQRGRWRPLAQKHKRVLLPGTERVDELRVGDSTAAGNCLFSSAAMLLYDGRRDDAAAKWLRAQCVLELAAHAREYREWLGGVAVRDVLASLLGGNGTSDPELDALWLLANVLRRRIVVCAEPHAQDACAARAFVPFRACLANAAPPAVLVLAHVHYQQRSPMANHYQPLVRTSGGAVLGDGFVRERCQLHRPTNRALFDQLAPLCGSWCATPTVIVADGDEPTPMRRDCDKLLDAPAPLDDALLAALRSRNAAVHSLLPTHAPSASCVAALCAQVCGASRSVLRTVIVDGVAPAHRSADALWAAGEPFAVLCRGAADVDGERHWLAARVQRPRVEWCSSHDAARVAHSGTKRQRGESRTQSAVAEREQVERVALVSALGLRDEKVEWRRTRSVAVDISRVQDAPLWAVSVVWLWAFVRADRVQRAQVDGATRLGCAIALTSDAHRLGAARGPPLRGLTPLCWLDGWHALAAQRAEHRALDAEQLSEESA